MSFLLSRTSTVLGVGLGLSFTLHPLSSFRASPIQCQYSAPYYRTDVPAATETGWGVPSDDPVLAKQGKTRPSTSSGSGALTASNMRQVSLGSVLGLVAGVGLRAFSRALVVLIGMGVVFVEVCSVFACWVVKGLADEWCGLSGLRLRGITSCL